MRTLRGGNSNLQNEKSKSKSENSDNFKDTVDDDDDVGANGDETTDDEGGVDTPPPPREEDEDSKGEEKPEDEDNEEDSVKNESATKEENEGEYEVEQIVDMQVQKRKRCPVQFRIRWLGFTEKEDTWVPALDLSCEELVQDFLEISGRKSEYEKAFESRKRVAESSVESCRQSSRKTTKITYSELDEDQDEILPSGTRTRKIKTKAEKKQMPNFTAVKKKKKTENNSLATKGPKKANQFEVEAIAGMRETKGRVEYKVRWKNWGPKYDSWLPEEELNCADILNNFKKTLEKLEKEEDWQVEKILDSRDRRGKTEFLIHWKGFESKFDTWEPKDNLQGCKGLLDKFAQLKDKEKEKVVKSPPEKVVKSPQEKVVKSPQEKVVKSPQEKVVKSPEEKVVKSPQEKVVKTPQEKGKSVRKSRKESLKPERLAENLSEGPRPRSKRKSNITSYTEHE